MVIGKNETDLCSSPWGRGPPIPMVFNHVAMLAVLASPAACRICQWSWKQEIPPLPYFAVVWCSCDMSFDCEIWINLAKYAKSGVQYQSKKLRCPDCLCVFWKELLLECRSKIWKMLGLSRWLQMPCFRRYRFRSLSNVLTSSFRC